MRVAFYEREITPPLGCSIPGYFNERLGSDVKDRLYAKSMVVEQGGETFAIVSVEGCGINTAVHNAVADRVTAFTGIQKENLMVSYVHTHTGIPRMTAPPKSEIAQDAEKGYFDVVTRLIADCVTLAYKRLEETTLYYGQGEVYGISFCRDYYMKNGTPRTNPERGSSDIIGPLSEIDPSLPVLFVRDKDGQPKGALINFGCHSDCVSGTEYTGDFSAIMAKELKKQYGDEFVTVFIMGPAGNVNHFDVTRESDPADHYIMMGKTLAGEAIKTIAQAKPVTGDVLAVAGKWLDLPSREISEEAIANAQHIVDTVKPIEGVKIDASGSTNQDQYNLAMAKSLLRATEGPKSYEVLVQAVRMGDVVLYSMPGEPYLQYGLELKVKSPTEKCFITTYTNRSVGYIPTVDVLEYDTIYSARFGANSLCRDAGHILVDTLKDLANSIF